MLGSQVFIVQRSSFISPVKFMDSGIFPDCLVNDPKFIIYQLDPPSFISYL